MSEGPRTITRNGRTAAVVVGAEQWQRETKRAGNLAEFFAGVSVARIEPEGPPAQGAPAENWSVDFLLDTNAVSEWVKPRPDPGVIRWMESVDEDRVFLSVISLGELRYGVERMAAGARRRRLEEWLQEELLLQFEGRILPVDSNTADSIA
jgi:hypothetical protein